MVRGWPRAGISWEVLCVFSPYPYTILSEVRGLYENPWENMTGQGAIWNRCLCFLKPKARSCLGETSLPWRKVRLPLSQLMRKPKGCCRWDGPLRAQHRDSSDRVGWCVCVHACVLICELEVHCQWAPWWGCWGIHLILSFSFRELQFGMASRLPTGTLCCLWNSLGWPGGNTVLQSQGISIASFILS